MRGYEGWSFANRSFLLAVLASLLWHFFWFFTVTVQVTPKARFVEKARPRMISLGPVLDDSVFRALVENKPQLSETFYRRDTDFSSSVDVAVKTVQRHETGEVVSLPFGKRVLTSMRHLLVGEKPSPDYELSSRIPIRYPSELPDIEGDVKGRTVLHIPDLPEAPVGMEQAMKESQIDLEFTVDASGATRQVEVLVSTGNPEIDLAWVRYLRNWQFAPTPLGTGQTVQKGRVRLRGSEARAPLTDDSR